MKALILILEDNDLDVRSLKKRINESSLASVVTVEPVYYAKGGVERQLNDVVDEAEKLILGKGLPAVLLVDVRTKTTQDFGLQVIRKVAADLRPNQPMANFLKDKNFLVFVITAHELPTPVLPAVWGGNDSDYLIRNINRLEDFVPKAILKEDAPSPIYVVLKRSREALVPGLIERWL